MGREDVALWTETGPVEIRIHFRRQGFRWPLGDLDLVELWDNTGFLVTLPGSAFRALLVQYLTTVRLMRLLAPPVESPMRRRRTPEAR